MAITTSSPDNRPTDSDADDQAIKPDSQSDPAGTGGSKQTTFMSEANLAPDLMGYFDSYLG